MAKILTRLFLFELFLSGAILILFFFFSYDAFLNLTNHDSSTVEFFTEDKFEAFQIRSFIFGLILIVLSLYVLFKKNIRFPIESALDFNLKEGKKSLRSLKKDFSDWSIYTRLVLFSLITIGLFLRIDLATSAISYDEAFTYTQYASKPYFMIVADYSYPNNHILNTLFVKVSTSIFGLSEFAMRIPALIASLFFLYLGFVFANRIKGKYAAFFFLFFIAVIPPLVEYGSYARGYSFLALFMLIIIYSLERFFETQKTYYLSWIIVVLVLGIWTVPVFAILVIPISMILYLKKKNFKSVSRFCIQVLAGAFLLYLPAIALYGISCLWNPPLQALGEEIQVDFMGMIKIMWKDLTYLMSVFLLIGLFIIFILSFNRIKRIHLFALFFFLIAGMMMLCKSELMLYRIWVFAWILFLWILSDGIYWQKWRNHVFVLLILGASVNFIFKYDKYEGRVERFEGLENKLLQFSNEKWIYAPFPMDAPVEFYIRKNNLDMHRTENPEVKLKAEYDADKYNRD